MKRKKGYFMRKGKVIEKGIKPTKTKVNLNKLKFARKGGDIIVMADLPKKDESHYVKTVKDIYDKLAGFDWDGVKQKDLIQRVKKYNKNYFNKQRNDSSLHPLHDEFKESLVKKINESLNAPISQKIINESIKDNEQLNDNI